MIVIAFCVSLFFATIRTELWQDPNYMVASEKPICIRATIHVAKELFDIKGEQEVADYYEQVCLEISKIFAWHNIKFMVARREFWSQQNHIKIGATITETMPYYSDYIKSVDDDSHVHILFLNIDNTETNLGKAHLGGACTPNSFAVTQVGNRAHWNPRYAGLIVAHEIGHLLGFQHVDQSNTTCKCPWEMDMCVMQPKTYFWHGKTQTSFDSCSIKEFIKNPKTCLLDCAGQLRSENNPVCGNNIKEADEECDCGFEESCIVTKRTCCNFTTCKFTDPSYKCEAGECCENCKFKRGNVCRKANDECDLPDFCRGDHPDCPYSHKRNGIKCANGQFYCHSGICRTKDSYCKILFPNSNATYSEACYAIAAARRENNCATTTIENLKNMFCGSGSGICGQVYCQGQINDPYYRFTSGSTTCYTLLDNEKNLDINKVPNGGKCGDGQVCYWTSCYPEKSIFAPCRRTCKQYEECNGYGYYSECVPNDPRWFTTYSGIPDVPTWQ